jgi:hypothetical protein
VLIVRRKKSAVTDRIYSIGNELTELILSAVDYRQTVDVANGQDKRIAFLRTRTHAALHPDEAGQKFRAACLLGRRQRAETDGIGQDFSSVAVGQYDGGCLYLFFWP